eukprot:CAMPEP_0184678558 /NCGR_PEP_ID=MMETSP0312-20130426/1305_1 /TAXON_ID=31354 /ORGANISM="Compsopogon coeruleus, Strain SAG 36.94" /LENGTH=377 /DNA_ID=CAMNT_0027127377 /DNA_START=372 /DNA_END=1505 /DNA_ORIENTATION=-
MTRSPLLKDPTQRSLTLEQRKWTSHKGLSSMVVRACVLLLWVSVAVVVTAQPCAVNNICFAIDESGSIDATEFQTESNAVGTIATRIDSISSSVGITTKYGAYGFSDRVKLISPLAQLPSLLAAITANTQTPGATYTGAALTSCRTLLSSASGVRVVVLVTDGVPTDDPGPAAAAIKANNIKLVTVGVGVTATAEALLKSLSSGPGFYINADNFTDLTTKISPIVQAICPTPSPCPTTNCRFALSSGGTIVRKGGIFITGVVGGTREAKIRDSTSGTYIPISQWSPPGLRQRFSPSFFKTFATVKPTMRSGVGYETPQQNQAEFLDYSCVILPFAAYQILDAAGNVINNVNTNDPLDCVSFQTDFPSAYDQATQLPP